MTTAVRTMLKGVVFDMDGTLTMPVIDFPGMYRAVLGDDYERIAAASGGRIDILHEIEQWSPRRQYKAYGIITQMEQEANGRLQIMPGARELCEFIDGKGIRRGLITRNVKDSVDYFHSCFGLKEFYPAVSREFRPYKPSAAPLLHICQIWGVSPKEVVMVGDSARDDVVCGKTAGALTCLLDESDRYDMTTLPSEECPHFKVKSLFEVRELLQQQFELCSLDTQSS